MNISELNINYEELAAARKTMHFGALDLPVRVYLPIADKTDLITFVINNSLDPATGTCAPVRVEIYFALAIAKWYADIEIDLSTPEVITSQYDILEKGNFNDALAVAIGPDYDKTVELVNETIEDMVRYNNSVAGMIGAISKETTDIDSEISNILEKIKNKEGIEFVSDIKNVVGTD